MSTFTDPLIVNVEQKETQGRGLARLVEGFQYYVGVEGSSDVINVPVGFETDFCSIPAFAMPLYPIMGKAAKAAVVHDYLCTHPDRPRAAIDKIFLEACTVLKVPAWRRVSMYLAIRAWVISVSAFDKIVTWFKKL